MLITVLDVGGTHVRWARWSPEQGLGDVRRTSSPSTFRQPGVSVDESRAVLVRMMAEVVPAGAVAGVSFGAALDHRTRAVYASAPLWGVDSRPFDLVAALRGARPDVRWHVVNDVTAALLHLASTQRARGLRKVWLATISTGVACRVIDQRTGEIPVDGCGLQGEIGHLPATVAVDGLPLDLRCDCGRQGHVAAYASGPGIRRLGEVLRHRRGPVWVASDLAQELARGEPFEVALTRAVRSGDTVAVELLAAAAKPIADIVRTSLCLDPELDLVAFTGGVALGLGEHYLAAVLAHLDRDGLYLTSERKPDWIRDRMAVTEVSGLVGAGIAALSEELT
ncbi:ROK family protein [Kutzneria sp. CA-103260]|uniref:ROK family protein n=1 Tax=Kutzneria sp. CA-103260 TaxID=2802641 RepID=UPI001BA5D8E5|nr:ROK family protein [Kutzneria sp. CA-103260]QUQ64991.1 sugar kinase [Kutzneria sp. CA-103260]